MENTMIDKKQQKINIDDDIVCMFKSISNSNPIYNPSKFWEKVNKINYIQLQQKDYSNFKRTVNQNYFNFWVMNPFHYQFRLVFLKMWAKFGDVITSEFEGDRYIEKFSLKTQLSETQIFFYKLFVSFLWEYTRKRDSENLLDRLEEPLEGNPLRIKYKGKLISQDLCNSVLQYYQVMNNIPHIDNIKPVIAELGAGYGRCAYVFLKARDCKYIIFDIPPALYISQRYLSSVFPDLKIFRFRDFKDYSEIKDEYESADILFFTPNQMELLPKKQFDIFVNISSLHEMTSEQIKHYFKLINEYCKGYFYTLQWKSWYNSDDNNVITYKDYPIPNYWKPLYFHSCDIQRKFFEALYRIDDIGV